MTDLRIPVTIITGFLGSGKTTLLNNLIKKYPQKKFAIIENEFGEIGIDGGLIVGAKDNIFELSNGCICCTLNADFYEVLEKLLNSPFPFNHLLVETTGIADPMTVVKSFLSSEDVQEQFRIDSVLCLADAINMEDLIDSEPEVRQQLALSDVVLLNKTESVQKQYIVNLTELIQSINPMAVVHPVSYANIENIEVLDTYAYSGRAIEKSTLSFQNLSVLSTGKTETNLGISNPLAKKHAHDIVSEGFSIPGNLDVGKFTLWMQNYLYFNADTIFRIKGILSFDDMRERYIFHAVRGSYTFELGDVWGDAPRFCKLVFIGKHIKRDELEVFLAQLSMSAPDIKMF